MGGGKRGNVHITSGGGIGGTCILFERSVLTSCIAKIRDNWYNDIPLDWMYRYFPKSPCKSLKLITKDPSEDSRLMSWLCAPRDHKKWW